MLTTGRQILELIPQRPPMVMIGALLSCDAEETVTSLSIDENNLFLARGLLSPSGLLENMAQTAAARTGWITKKQRGQANKPAPVGVIGSIKNFKAHFLPGAGSELITTIRIGFELANATLVSGRVEVNGKLAAEAEMQIFLTENET